MKVLTLPEIKSILPSIDLLPTIEAGFAGYSAGKAVVPPVGELLFESPPGDVHLKYGYLKEDDYYVIKIASGFYDNPKLGLSSSNGLMLLFSQKTGELQCVLLDEGYLTDIRTAAAGAICAKYLAPETVERIGIIGTGIQARLQLQHLLSVTDCRDVVVWGRSADKLASYAADVAEWGVIVSPTTDSRDIGQTCNLIVTTTPATTPLLQWDELGNQDILITAMGADTAHKQELDSRILANADLVVADSIPQCLERGEIFKAVQAGLIEKTQLIELGQVLLGQQPQRRSHQRVVVADLTGVAVQDIQIAKAVFEASL